MHWFTQRTCTPLLAEQGEMFARVDVTLEASESAVRICVCV
jgi:hypothetical protein